MNKIKIKLSMLIINSYNDLKLNFNSFVHKVIILLNSM